MTDKENGRIQIACCVGMASLLLMMVVVTFSDEQSIRAFLFPDWLGHLLVFKVLGRFGPLGPALIVLLAQSFWALWKKRATKDRAELIR